MVAAGALETSYPGKVMRLIVEESSASGWETLRIPVVR
jgi:hypothetical protein